MQSKEVQSWQEQTALERYGWIAPLLDPILDTAAKTKIREEISKRENISVRTLYRYETSFQKNGFQGLKPQSKNQGFSKKLPPNYPELLDQAIQLKREVPKRSVAQIIWILELEGRVAPGVLKRSTLERHLYRAGYGVRQMQMYNDARESSSKRFCKPHRMMLVQGDIKYGCKLPIGKNGAMVMTYLSSAIDDHSRMILSSEFYDNQEEQIVEDTFRKVILLYGKFDACYFDNGGQYVARQLKLSLGKLGIPIRYARPRSGKSKGKIEKFHQVVDDFLREFKLCKKKTLEELNRRWKIYLEEAYQTHSHDGIAEYYRSLNAEVPECGISPVQEWNRDTRNLVYLDTSIVTEAFLHHEWRNVDKGACISFRGRRYETKPSLIGFRVEISYDPRYPEVLTVSHEGVAPFVARPIRIGAFCDKNPTLPISMQPEIPETSRFLDALEKKNEQTRMQAANAISFSHYGKEVHDDV